MALVGFGSSLMMPYVPPVNPELKWTWNPFASYIHGIRSMRATSKDSRGRSVLWTAVLIWAAFWMVAIVVLAIVPEYQAPLHLSSGEASGLLAALGIGLVFGCLGVAVISGKRIRPWFVPIGALGMGAVMFALGLLPASEKTSPLWLLWVGLILAGFFGGFFLVPLMAIQQALAVSGLRARVLGTANAMSFLLMAIASFLYLMAVKYLPVHPSRFLMVCGVGMGLLAIWSLTGGRSIFNVRNYPDQVGEAPDSSAGASEPS
jgi:acyl-[acyl-carrier-protein]-phospholipid O-acyltransferase/long-chain-fatty-acid--[acyl-carrier-protein] ligase